MATSSTTQPAAGKESLAAPPESVPASTPRRRGGSSHHHHQHQHRHVCGRRCFLVSLALAVVLVTILQYSFSVTHYLQHSSDLWHATESSWRSQFSVASLQDPPVTVVGVDSRSGSHEIRGSTGQSKKAVPHKNHSQSIKTNGTDSQTIKTDGTKAPVRNDRPLDLAPSAKLESPRTSDPSQHRNNETSSASSPSSPHYYMIFSSSCVPLQHWQSYLLFYSAYKVGQPGNVTRIVSGCKPAEAAALAHFHEQYIRPMSENFHVHFTPDFAAMHLEDGQHPYKYMNKPFGVRHWMEHALGMGRGHNVSQQVLDGIIMLLDPDMVLLRPLRHDFTHEEVLWVEQNPVSKVVRHGYQIAQQDAYLGNAWMHLNWTHVTGLPKGKYLEPPLESKHDGPRIWNSGPPYLATVQDMYRIAQRWTDYSPRVLDIDSSIYAEMYGYIIASYQLRLPHTLIKSIVVSETGTVKHEGWKYIDQLSDDQVCPVDDDLPMPPSAQMPVGLHYCQRYMLGEHFFVKYRVKKNNFNCSKPLYAMPPRDLHQKYNYSVVPMRSDLSDESTWKAKRSPMSPKQAKREAFMLCRLIPYLNDALRYYKDRACGIGQGNRNETISVYVDPSDW